VAKARMASRILRLMVRSGVRRVVLINCWVMVEPPWRFFLKTMFKKARVIPSQAKPWCL